MTTVTIVLPLITYTLFVFILARKGSLKELQNALVKGHVVYFAFIAVLTEILSAFHLIDFPHLLGVWGLVCLICFFAAAFTKRARDKFSLSEAFHNISPLSILLLGAIIFILATTFATAILYPPNNWDSMTYHMARVENWISNKSVAFYPTAIDRQNIQLPLAEFAVMHFQLLAGSDLFANLIQWMCFLISIVLSALIAAELGLEKKYQAVSSVVFATIPMAILQSTSTQNDLVVSSFVLSFAFFMLRLRRELTAGNIGFAALSLGLALLTKGTAYIYCAAIGATLAAPILLKAKSNYSLLIKSLGSLSLVVLIALAINIGYFVRSYRLYGTPISSGEITYWNQDLSIGALLSNIPRNLSLHLGIPSQRINNYIYRAFELALGKQMNNPGTTLPSNSFRIQYNRHEDTAGNPIHILVTLFALVAAVFWMQKQHSHRNWYAIGVCLGGILYCVCLKWQPYASRLHTPLFALSAPVIAIMLAKYAKRGKRYVSYAVMASMILYSLPFVLTNPSRSLLSQEWRRTKRLQLYFHNNPSLFESYSAAMHILGKVQAQDVGLYLGNDDWEYPFWVFAKENLKSYSNIRFRHIGVDNRSKILQKETYLPESLLSKIT